MWFARRLSSRTPFTPWFIDVLDEDEDDEMEFFKLIFGDERLFANEIVLESRGEWWTVVVGGKTLLFCVLKIDWSWFCERKSLLVWVGEFNGDDLNGCTNVEEGIGLDGWVHINSLDVCIIKYMFSLLLFKLANAFDKLNELFDFTEFKFGPFKSIFALKYGLNDWELTGTHFFPISPLGKIRLMLLIGEFCKAIFVRIKIY